MTPDRSAALATVAALLLLPSCARVGIGDGPAARPASAAAWPSRKEVGEAIALLNAGRPADAREKLTRALKRQPGDAVAASLIKQIDIPPETLLGKASFGYVMRPTDSWSSLAQRFLGDPMLFYALARYNGIDAPGRIEPGRKLRIPGRESRETPRPERPAAAAKPVAAPKPTAPRPPVATPAPTPPKAATANPQRARQLRAAGLEQMNRGAIDRAVTLLQQASRSDPANALIARDLQRALRIRQTVRAGR